MVHGRGPLDQSHPLLLLHPTAYCRLARQFSQLAYPSGTFLQARRL